jgi:late competence protein required for DNA uptake (superfamily II DNA/RNA helicase)
MIKEEKVKCNNCGNKYKSVTYDCINEAYYCDGCNKCKPEHSDKAIEKAFKKLTDQHMRRWYR